MKQVLTLMAFLTAGCATGETRTAHVMSATGGPAAMHSGPVRIVLESDPIPDGFVDVALIQATGLGTEADMPHVIAGLTAEARKLGCNAVVKVRFDQGASTANGMGIAGRLP